MAGSGSFTRGGQARSVPDTLADRMYRPPADDLTELRKQQAAFQETERAISRDNAWMAVPALAPVAVVAGLGAAGALATRIGRRAHADLKKRVVEKLNWEPDVGMTLKDGRVVRPDVRTPLRLRPAGDKPVPYQMELKPNTVSGRKAAARAVKMYSSTGTKTRAIFYDPKHYR